MIMLKSLII